MKGLPEQLVKVKLIGVTDPFNDFRNRQIGMFQVVTRFVHTALEQQLGKIFTRLAQQLGKVTGGVFEVLGHLV